jgi:hypothetical protein
MEKKRFWRLCDRLPDGSTSKRRLLELWGHEFGASARRPRCHGGDRKRSDAPFS